MTRPHPLSGDPSVREVSVPVTTVWTSPESPRDLDALAVADDADADAWARSMDAEVRLGLHGRTQTQLLMGEPAQVLEEQDGWARVVALGQASSRDERGYPGWVRAAHLGTPVPQWRGASATVISPSTTGTVDGTGLVLSFGTVLWVAGLGAETVSAHLPDGRQAEVPLADVRLGHPGQQPVYGADDLLAAARQFLGVRYLWGGTSGFGLDCSGLVSLTYRSFGVLLPRDAHDQAARLEPVDLDVVRPGDLYFFAEAGGGVDHVGLVSQPVRPDGTRWMLHAPEGTERVEDAPLAPHRVERLVGAARVAKPGR